MDLSSACNAAGGNSHTSVETSAASLRPPGRHEGCGTQPLSLLSPQCLSSPSEPRASPSAVCPVSPWLKKTVKVAISAYGDPSTLKPCLSRQKVPDLPPLPLPQSHRSLLAHSDPCVCPELRVGPEAVQTYLVSPYP